MDDIAQITEQLKSSSVSDGIKNKEDDPSTSSNVYRDNLKPIQPKLAKKEEYKLSSDGRRFNAEFFQTYEWLEFSLIENKCYCFCCRMFNPFSAIKDGIKVDSNYYRKLKQHNDTSIHQNCMERWKLRQITDKNKNSIACQTNSHHSIQVKQNRENLKIVIQVLIFLAKQGLPLRGHDESENSKNKGNFLELIDLIATFVPSFKKYVESKSYLHHSYQNELIEIIANRLIKIILPKEYFSIILDETMDIGKDEQIAFCMRYMDENLEIQEHFFGFFKTDTTTSDDLFTRVNEIMKKLSLDFQKIVGQGYDGASNMSGCKNGLATQILRLNSKALYQHCKGHLLNLSLKDAANSIPEVVNTFTLVNLVYDFVEGSAKRHAMFKHIQGNERAMTLKNLCATRWGDRLNAFHAQVATYQEVLTFLEILKDEDRTEVGAKATGILYKIKNFKYLFIVSLIEQIFALTNILSVLCQKINNHLQSILDTATSIVVKLTEMITLFDEFFQKVLEQAKNCDLEDIPLTYLRSNQSNTEENKKWKTFYLVLHKKILNAFIKEIGERFDPKNLDPLITIYNILNDSEKLVKNEKIKEDLTIYKDIIDIQKLFREFDLFYTIKSSLNLDNFDKLYSYLKLKQDFRESFKTGFPNILVLLKIYLTSPIASVTSERGFSCLKRIKTYLRSTMLQERLSSLAILNFESEFIKLINIEDVIDEFANNKNRKFAFF